MRKKPMQNNYGGHKRNHRYGGDRSGNDRSGGGSHHNRPRKNYGAMREKYLNQARDAMASGDRVMAEYFYQHADHCWRMMMEEGQNRPPRAQNAPPQAGDPAAPIQDEAVPENTNQLPAFLTAGYTQPQNQEPAEAVPPVQNWEERDA